MIKKGIYTLFLCGFSIMSTAQNQYSKDTVATQALDPVTVTASRISGANDNLPYPVSVFSTNRTDITRQQLSLREYMEEIPGVFAQNANNFAQDLRISIRGFGARSSFGIRGIKLIVDGIPETTPDGQGQLDNLNLGIIDRIEVIKGPSSSLYGNASGGVISVQTQTDFENPFTILKASVGSYHIQQYQFTTGFRTSKTTYMLHGNYTAGDGYREQSGFRQLGVNATITHQFNEKTQVRLLLNYANSPEADDAGGLNIDEVTANRRQVRAANRDFQTGEAINQLKTGVSLSSKVKENMLLKSYAFYSYRDFSGRLPFSNGGIVGLHRNYSGHGSSLEYRLDGNRLQLGYDLAFQSDQRQRYINIEGERGSLTFDQKERFNNIGLYITDHLSIGAWYFSGGLRFDWNRLEALDAFLENGDDSDRIGLLSLNPSIGVNYAFADKQHVFANFSTGFETPSLSELSADPNGGQGFNNDLKPQQAHSYEIGFKGRFDNELTYQLSYFYIDTRNDLIPFELEDFPERTFYRNAGKTRRHGIETEWRYSIDNWEFRAAYSYTDFSYQNYTIPNGNFEGNALPGIPKHLGSFSVYYVSDTGLYGALHHQFASKQYTNDANTDTATGYILMNLRLGYALVMQKLSLKPFIGLNNLLNRTYFDNVRINAFGGRYYEPAPQINAFGGLVVIF